MRTKKKLILSIALIVIALLPLLFVSVSGGTSNSDLSQLSPADSTMTGVISAVQSGTISTSSWSVGPHPNPVGTIVTVDLRIDGATPQTIWSWRTSLNWTASVLQLTKIKEGNFLKDSGDTTMMIGGSADFWNNTAGYLLGELACADTASLTAPMTAASGVLATLTFKIVGYGDGAITIYNSNLRSHSPADNPDELGIPVPSNSAVVTVISPGPVKLVSFQEQGLVAGTQWTVTCNGQSTSSTTPEISYSLVPDTYSYTIEGILGYSISPQSGAITVSDQDINVPITFTPSSSFDGCTLDVFTERGGVGLGVNNGAYGPQELIKICALVKFNGAPVSSQEVSFTAKNANGDVVFLRAASTNATGYAYLEYRLPWPDTNNPEIVFGDWSITASTSFSTNTVSDTVHFTYNYIVQVANINDIQLPTNAKRQSTININVTVQNMASESMWSTLSVTVYDEAKIPIGSFITTNNQTAGSSIIKATITIPSWAFVGTATVYVDILTNTPAKNGVPYCPEEVANFQITP